MVEGEWLPAGEAREVEFGGREDPRFDGALVGAEFRFGQLGEEPGPLFGGELADIAHGIAGAAEAGGEALGVGGRFAEELRIMDLHLADLVGIGRGDPAARGAARLLAEHVDAVVFPSQVEDAMGDVADHAAFVDEQAVQDGDADLLEGERLPEGLAGVGDHAGAEREAGHVVFGDAAGQQVELEPRDRVARVGPAVHLEDGSDHVAAAGELLQFADDLRDKATLTLVPHADANVGDEVALERSEGHGQEGVKRAGWADRKAEGTARALRPWGSSGSRRSR